MTWGDLRQVLRLPIFFHPDCTVGFGVSPNHALRLVGYTTGRESHPALKIYPIFTRQSIRPLSGFVKHKNPGGVHGEPCRKNLPPYGGKRVKKPEREVANWDRGGDDPLQSLPLGEGGGVSRRMRGSPTAWFMSRPVGLLSLQGTAWLLKPSPFQGEGAPVRTLERMRVGCVVPQGTFKTRFFFPAGKRTVFGIQRKRGSRAG